MMNKQIPPVVIDSPFNALLGIQSEEELYQSATKLAKQMGFEHFLFATQLNASFVRPIRSVYGNYPEEWLGRYIRNKYEAVDPIILHCQRNSTPLIWNDALFAGQAEEFWEEAKSYGLVGGITLPIHNHAGAAGLLSLVRDKPLEIEPTEMMSLVGQAYLLACYMHTTSLNRLAPKVTSAGAPQLTERERECLLWSAEGKTAWEIGQILSISERTVIFHIKNSVQKLGAKNKIQALVRAIALGIFY